jgi:hypothetical protein
LTPNLSIPAKLSFDLRSPNNTKLKWLIEGFCP